MNCQEYYRRFTHFTYFLTHFAEYESELYRSARRNNQEIAVLLLYLSKGCCTLCRVVTLWITNKLKTIGNLSNFIQHTILLTRQNLSQSCPLYPRNGGFEAGDTTLIHQTQDCRQKKKRCHPKQFEDVFK
jgi:hypothetical protein